MESICDGKQFEVLLTSDSSGQNCNTSAWDPSTGSCLHQWKGGTSLPRTLSLVGSDYLISGQPNKPLLNVWQVNRSEQLPLRLFTPGPPSALAVSPSGNYLAVAVQENINIWQVGTGSLLAVVTRHYQPVTVLRFTRDGSHLVSGGEDGQVLVWSLVQCVARRTLPGQERGEVGQVEPRYTWTDHALPVTDLHCGHASSAPACRVFTASLDQVVRVYSMAGGQQLLAVSLPHPLTCLAVDNLETMVWVGTKQGSIHTFSLLTPPRDVSVTVDRIAGSRTLAGGHKEEVSCLALSMDSLTLASGGKDSSVVLWDTVSGQAVRTLAHKEVVTCVQFTATPPALLGGQWAPARRLVGLQKGAGQQEFSCNILRREDCGVEREREREEESVVMVQGEEGREKQEEFTMQELKQINNQLYKYALKNVLQS